MSSKGQHSVVKLCRCYPGCRHVRHLVCWLTITLCVLLVATVWRQLSLNRVPEIGNPFADVPPVMVSSEDNAALVYDAIRLTPEPSDRLTTPFDWSEVSDDCKEWLAENQSQLPMMEIAAEKSLSMRCIPSQHDFSTISGVASNRALSRFAVLNASRCLNSQDRLAAWYWLRVAFRHSRHCGMGGTHVERLSGAAFHSEIVRQMLHWAAQRDVDEPALRQAVRDVQIDFGLTPRPSESLCNEYDFGANTFDDWWVEHRRQSAVGQIWLDWFQAEPKRTRRLVNLVYSNWKHQIDLPLDQQKKLSNSLLGLFVNSPEAGVAEPDARTLEQLCRSSAGAASFFQNRRAIPAGMRLELARQHLLQIGLASHCFYRQHRRFPLNVAEFENALPDGWPADPACLPDSPFSKAVPRIGYRCFNDSQSALVWSAGYDGDDDGGKIDTHPGDSQHDVGYLLQVGL